jgi:lipopolysaccharide heptosyltransferase III
LKILLIQLKRIGDLILTVPAIAALRNNFPKATIHLAIAHSGKDLAPAIAGVDRFLVADSWRRAPDWFAILKTRYDYCLDFTRTDRSAFLTFVSSAKKKISFERTRVRSKWPLLVYDQFVDSSVRDKHTIDHHLAFLAPLGITDTDGELQLALPNEAMRRAEEILSRFKIATPFVLFHPGSARQEKFWPAQNWVDVIDRCVRDHGWQCVLTGGRSPFEQVHLAEIKAQLPSSVIDLSGQTDLLTLTALIAKAGLLISVDSAPTHLAAAMRTPQIVLYGPTNPFHWRPRASPALILQGGFDGPIINFSPDQPRTAMNEISTEQVIDAMETVLSAPAAAPIS